MLYNSQMNRDCLKSILAYVTKDIMEMYKSPDVIDLIRRLIYRDTLLVTTRYTLKQLLNICMYHTPQEYPPNLPLLSNFSFGSIGIPNIGVLHTPIDIFTKLNTEDRLYMLTNKGEVCYYGRIITGIPPVKMLAYAEILFVLCDSGLVLLINHSDNIILATCKLNPNFKAINICCTKDVLYMLSEDGYVYSAETKMRPNMASSVKIVDRLENITEITVSNGVLLALDVDGNLIS